MGLKEQGFQDKEIAERLGISINTTKKRLKQAYRKLAARNALEALFILRRLQEDLAELAPPPRAPYLSGDSFGVLSGPGN